MVDLFELDLPEEYARSTNSAALMPPRRWPREAPSVPPPGFLIEPSIPIRRAFRTPSKVFGVSSGGLRDPFGGVPLRFTGSWGRWNGPTTPSVVPNCSQSLLSHRNLSIASFSISCLFVLNWEHDWLFVCMFMLVILVHLTPFSVHPSISANVSSHNENH